METRVKEVKELAEALKKGLPRSCAEQWLTVPDGGLQESRQVRYFLEPELKVVVPYSQGREPQLEDFVDGPSKVYQEAYIAD